MNILQYLVESTYNVGHAVDQIYKEIIGPIVNRMKKGEIANIRNVDVKPYLNYILDRYTKDWKVDILLSFRQSPKLQSQIYWEKEKDPNLKERTLLISLNIPKKEIKTLNSKQIKELISDDLTHELIHLIDKVRSSFKSKEIDTENLYKYARNPMEFNAFINGIKKYIASNRKTWNKIQSLEELKEALQRTTAIFSNIKIGNPNGYKVLEKKLLARMARENMLPTDMINKYDAY